MASANDLLMEVGDPGTATTLAAPGYTVGNASITVGSTSNWPTATGGVFAIDEAEVVNGVEQQVAGTYNEYVATVASGTQLTNVAWVRGVGDRDYAAGPLTRVYIPVSAERENRIVEWGLVAHNQDGTHKAFTESNIVPTSAVQDSAITTAKLADGGVTPEKISASAITLGYSEITTTFSSATGGNTQVDVTGLSVNFTVPAGGRRVKVTAWSRLCASTHAAGNGIDIYITDSSNNVKAIASATTPVTSYGLHLEAIYSAVLSAGSYTYKVRMGQGSSGTMQMAAAANSPAFLLVELI